MRLEKITKSTHVPAELVVQYCSRLDEIAMASLKASLDVQMKFCN